MKKRVVIVGLGALGSHVVLLARNWDVDLVLIDFDRVESKNCASQMHPVKSVRALKARAMKQLLAGWFRVAATDVNVKLSSLNVLELLGGADLVIDCTDNMEARTLIKECASPSVHGALAAGGDFGLVMWSDMFTPDPESQGVPTCEDGEHLPFIAIVAARLALSAQTFLSTGKQLSFEVALSGCRRR